jgi:predicted Zn-dependent protease with MMP-like domain
MDFETLSLWANEELKSLIKVLPHDVQVAARKLPVSFEEKPGQGACDNALAGDELGLFEGPCELDASDTTELPRIRLFLGNLWDWVEGDEQDYRDEIGTTFLHELGHYLGWDEDDVNERGLE